MTSLVVEATFSTALLASILLTWLLWRGHKAKLCEKERKWREAQAAQLKSVKERLQEAIDPAAAHYTELPGAPTGRVA
jgi:hypothetical protein